MIKTTFFLTNLVYQVKDLFLWFSPRSFGLLTILLPMNRAPPVKGHYFIYDDVRRAYVHVAMSSGTAPIHITFLQPLEGQTLFPLPHQGAEPYPPTLRRRWHVHAHVQSNVQ
jgi:hypothetical protein